MAIASPGSADDTQLAAALSCPLRELDSLSMAFAGLAHAAGEAILSLYDDGVAFQLKPDGSPVSEADERAEEIILAGLSTLLPGVPIVAEECVTRSGVPALDGREFVLVDPLDGTKEFINRNGEFTVNIAIVSGGRPRAGVVYAPALGNYYLGGETARACTAPRGQRPAAADSRVISTRQRPGSLIAVASRSHRDQETQKFLQGLSISELRSVGSSLKFCLLASGEADVYPRFGPTMEWDTAAGHAVLLAAGGRVTDLNGDTFSYGKSQCAFRNSGFIAWGRSA